MKKIKMIVSAAVVLFVVSGALAFKPLNAGSIYCFLQADVTPVNKVKPGFACNDASQQPTNVTIVDWAFSTTITDPTTNPCPTGRVPFNGAPLSGQCIQTTPGTDHYVQTLP